MMSLTSFVILAASIAAVASQLTVNTPTSVVHCLPAQVTWSGGQEPYYVSILPGGQPSAPPLVDFGKQTGTSISWTASLPANTPCTVQIRDATGALNYSDQFTIQSGSSTATCKDDSGASSTPTTSAPGTTSTGVAAANSTAPKTSTTTSNTTSSTTSSSKATPSSTSSTSGGSSPSTSTTSTSPVNASSPANDARSDASRTSAGIMAVAVAVVVAVFA